MNSNPDKPSLLAIDIGTTSTKGLLVDAGGNVIATQQKFYDTLFPQYGFAEQDPEAIAAAVWSIIQTISDNQRPLGISFSSAMHSIMAVDQNGKPLTPLIIWSDTRSTLQAAQLEASAAQLYKITGTPVHPMSPLCKLLWLKENQPEIFESAYKFISIKEFIFFRLTGEFVVDYSVASATGLFDIDKKQWSTLVLKILDLKEEKLSRVVPTQSILKFKKELANTLHLENTSLIAGASDGCLAQLGSHAMGQGDMSITLGTSGAVRVATRQRKIDPLARIFNYILDDQFFICGGATNTGTALLNWYSKNIDTEASTDIQEFVHQVKEIPEGCDGLLLIPYLLGERAPIYRAEARGVFFGISIQHGKLHFQRALLEAICLQLRWIKESVEDLFGPSQKILVSGGFTRSEEWVQLLCNVLGKPLALGETNDASAMGAAFVGFRALGIACDFHPATPRVFQPDMKSHELYSSIYKKYRQLYSAVENL